MKTEISRIYQGRVNGVEIHDAENAEFQKFPTSPGSDECPLWRHHETFQDAVNYYLLALGALANQEGTENRVAADLRSRLGNAWEKFPRDDANRLGAKSLRDSVAPWLGLDGNATLDKTFDAILQGEEDLKDARHLALLLLLDKCGGDGAIQQGGRTYFPKFCDKETKAKGDFDTAAIAARTGQEKLAEILHGNPTLRELEQIASEMDLSWMIAIEPDKFYIGEDAKNRIREALDCLSEMLDNPNENLRTWLAEIPDPQKELDRLKMNADELPDDISLQKNRRVVPLRRCTATAFKFFPCRLTQILLKSQLKKPAQKKSAEPDKIDFAALGDDPIKLARGTRNYVFRAFTALPKWNPEDPGSPSWSKFDIAAFKEALKSLNQFNQKTKEREEKRADLGGRIAHMTGQPVDGWKPARTEGDEESAPPPLLADDPRFELARELEGQLALDLNETAEENEVALPEDRKFQESDWKITRASLRGFRDIQTTWNKEHKRADGQPKRKDLEEVIKNFQRDPKNKRSVGSLPLFLALCEKTYWPLWLDAKSTEDEPDDSDENAALSKPGGMLFAMAGFHELVRDYQRSLEPIRLTPAEPRHSRRLYMFSDMMTPKEKDVLLPKTTRESFFEAQIAYWNGNQFEQRKARIHFTAPRLRRDRLADGSESRWLQPMLEALFESSEPLPSAFEKMAVALMPDFGRRGEARHLLNFPVTLNTGEIQKRIGKAALWPKQFNGTKDKFLHLHWPSTVKPATKESPWWKNPRLIRDGFTILSVDLGQRSAGAWALLHITAKRPEPGRPSRRIGHDGENEWFASIKATGMLRLPGEDARLPDSAGRFVREPWGKAGRNASAEEWEQGKRLAVSLLADQPEAWVGHNPEERSFPEQNDALVALANRRLSRLNTFHRWSCFDPDRKEVKGRRTSIIASLKAELEAWKDQEVRDLIPALGDESDDFSACDPQKVRHIAEKRFLRLRRELEPRLVDLADRVVPLRTRSWTWKLRNDGTPYGELLDNGERPAKTPKIRGQRGLSMRRIEQLENLRRLFLRFNRSLDREPGKPAVFGRADAGRESGEPCRSLLEKIDAMKEQRVNQTAHLILAQALGLRLRNHELPPEDRARRDVHGEYEKIPGRAPVDLVVIENLDRYLTSQGRAPMENSRLMKWAHRAIRDKIKMLAEDPFGIHVVEAAAAYSSRFCAVSAQAGARCVESNNLGESNRRFLEHKIEQGGAEAIPYKRILEQFEELETINKTRKNKKLRTLLLPRAGGPLFLGAMDGNPVQADINASVNIGLRAVAAPDAIDILHKVRTEYKGSRWLPVAKNAREKAAFKKKIPLELQGEPSKKLASATRPNLFQDSAKIAPFDRTELVIDEQTFPLASGVALWSAVNRRFPERIAEINQTRLEKWK